MIRKVIAAAELKRAAGTVTEALARWLAGKAYVSSQEGEGGVARGAQATRNLPRARRRAVGTCSGAGLCECSGSCE